MTRSLKNIFAITALTLTCSPALYCEDTARQTASKSKLQSAINYVKNIRTPLTPQETLAQFIAQGDINGFKNTYSSFQKWTPSDRTATLEALAVTAQEIKQQLQAELDTAGNKVKKSTLAKGVAQTIFGTYCTLATMFSLAYKGECFDTDYYSDQGEIKSSFMSNLVSHLEDHYLYIHGPEKLPCYLRINGYQKLAALTNIIVTPLTGYIAYNSFKAGIENCKNGWNYKTYIEKQIANIDEINEFIQANLTLRYH